MAGMPVATERNVPPIHGSDVAVSTLAPPLPVQAAPKEEALAGHVLARLANATETRPFTSENQPPTATLPLRRFARALTGPFGPEPKPDQDAPSKRARPRIGAPPANSKPPPT